MTNWYYYGNIITRGEPMELKINKHSTPGNIITTNLPYVPTFEDIFPRVRPLLVVTTQAIEEAIPNAKGFFEAQGKSIDKYLFPNIVRYHIKCFMETTGLSVVMDEDEESVIEYQFQRLVNNGLSGIFSGFRFRILKADQGDLPIPGPSELKQQYYNQQLPLQFDIPLEEYIKSVHPNLIILWEVDNQHNFFQLRLACPKTGGKTRHSVEAYFNEPIPHAAELVKSKTIREPEEDIQITKKQTKTPLEHIDDIR